jgi:hypothetical protein
MKVARLAIVLLSVAAPALAGFSVDLPLVAGLQGVSTRFYTSIDVTNNSSGPTDVIFEYIATDLSVDVAGTLVTGLPAYGNFHADDLMVYLAGQGYLTQGQSTNTKGTLLLTFTAAGFTTGSEASASVRTYNYITAGQAPSVGYAYRAIPLRKNGSHTVSSIINDTSTAGSGSQVITNLGIENVGIDDNGAVVAAPITVQLTFRDPTTGAVVGQQPTVQLAPGQVTQLNDVWTKYGLPHSLQAVLVSAAETAGTAQIRGYVIAKDLYTNDGSFLFMQ